MLYYTLVEDTMRDTSYVRVNFTLPKDIYLAFKILVPERKRSRLVTSLIAGKVKKLEEGLVKAAEAVEKDKALNKELADWDSTLADGLDETRWK
jgi:hypothetical protein